MTWTQPLALWALLAVPAVIALHLFRRPLPERQVAGLFLFAGDEPLPPDGSARQRLRWSWPLVLECAAAAVLALWLAGPVWGAGAMGRHLVVVLDDSASMAGPGGEAAVTARDAALAHLQRAAADLGSEGRLTVIAAGRSPRVVLGPEAPATLWTELGRGEAEAYEPAAIATDLGAAVTLAETFGGDGAQLLLLTDRPVGPDFAPRWTVASLGRSAANVAIAAAQRVVGGDGRETVHVSLQGWGADGTRAVRVHRGDGELLGEGTVGVIADGEVTMGSVALGVGSAGDDLVVSLGGADGLSIDDSVVLVPEPERRVAVGFAGDPTAREAMGWSRLASVADGAEERNPADLLLTDEPGTPAADAAVRLVVRPTDGPRAAVTGGLLADRSHPVLDGVGLGGAEFEGVVWLGGAAAPPGRPLLTAGDRVLLSVVETFDQLTAHANLDPAASTVCDSALWPALWVNLVELARDRLPGVRRANVRSGEAMTWRTATATRGSPWELEDPRGRRHPGTGVRTLRWEATVPGVHVLHRDGVAVGRFGVQFHAPRESDLRARGGGLRPPAAVMEVTADEAGDPGAGARAGRGERVGLGLLLLALVVANWWLQGRSRR